MEKSLFAEYIDKLYPKLAAYIEKVNGKRTQPTYLHKTMLRKEYSADQKWESASLNTTYVTADIVAMDSPLPLKKRDSIAVANGKLPKVGLKKALKETQLNQLNIMKARGDNWTTIANKLLQDSVACSASIDEQVEAMFLHALSDGAILVPDEANSTEGLRIDFKFKPENTFGVTTAGSLTLDDIKRVLAKADADGNAITTIAIALSTYNKLRGTRGAKELVATYRGQSYDANTNLPVPTASIFDEAFADDNNGVKFLKIDRSVIKETNGIQKAEKPWNAKKLTFLTNDTEVGALVWGTLAESTNPVGGVTYQTVDQYKLIKKYSITDPLQEFTAGEALVLPVIENVDQLYSLDISDGQAVDTTAEASDTSDTYVTVWGNKYTKANFVTALSSLTGEQITDTSDANIIAIVNGLNKRTQTALKDAVSSYIVA